MKNQNTYILSLLFLGSILFSCNEHTTDEPNIRELEVEVIRNTIHELTPDKPAQISIVYLSSEDDKIDKWRLDSVNF